MKTEQNDIATIPVQREISEQFYLDVLYGLSASPKHLDSKYFYDETGDRLFQKIMNSPEYYLTDCEMEILRQQSGHIASQLLSTGQSMNVVELGAGDASKSIFLLKSLLQKNQEIVYYPIDISGNVIQQLNQTLPHKIPGLTVYGLEGEYLRMLDHYNSITTKPKLVLFMGANIGNMTPVKARDFLRELRTKLGKNDRLLIGFDLKKNPKTVLNAYNDEAGYTARFNLNLLRRINRELEGNFNLDQFEHYPNYDPISGACKSYLVSSKDQLVQIGRDFTIRFEKDEPIYMEISQKYHVNEVDQLAQQCGFKPVAKFFDSKRWFVDSLWETV